MKKEYAEPECTLKELSGSDIIICSVGDPIKEGDTTVIEEG